ncbi:MAG: c-type cytochrome, partial [Chitinophagaceae bacterium]
ATTQDEKSLEKSWAMRWLALFSGDTRALTGKHKDVVMEGHDYDGIVEFDNDLPPWWKYMFYISILWAGAYLIYYHVTETGDLQTAEYHAEMQAAALIASQNVDDPSAKTDFKVLTEATALEEGKKIFAQNCAACHGQSGEGTVGPNLTDEFWLHGGDVNDVFKTVKFGVPAKGMVAWNKKLNKEQILQVSSYILSLQGTKPANAKEPQGEKVAMK